MNFDFSDDQKLLKEQVAKFLADKCPLKVVRRVLDGNEAFAGEVWKGLVAGRWSLVDHIDTDGKRFLLALKNKPSVDKRADLTPRERRVCALVAMGHRDKEIAYMLGVSMASVAASIHRARRKLNVGTRTALAGAWRGGHTTEQRTDPNEEC